MNTKDKKSKSKKLPAILTIIGVLLVTGVVTSFIFQDNIKATVADIKTDIENKGKPKFILDTAQVPGWYTSGTYHTTKEDYDQSADKTLKQGDLSVSFTSIHQCKVVGQCKNEHDLGGHCFVTLSYYKRPINVDKEFKDKNDAIAKEADSSLVTQDIGAKTLTLNTPEGQKEYQLHYYQLTGPDSAQLQRGTSRGYALLKDGYVDIQSVCGEASQLDEALPALNAVRVAV